MPINSPAWTHTLREIEGKLGALGEKLGRIDDINKGSPGTMMLDEANKTMKQLHGICALFFLLSSVGFLAIIGTLRHWF